MATADPNGDREELDQRVQRSRAAVLAATAELLFERGFSGASVDEISRRSGVAKTTIYRHWPRRSDLLRDACATISTPMEAPNTGRADADIATLMKQLAKILRSAKWTSVLPSIVDAAERDAGVAAMYAILQRGHSSPFETVIRRGLAAGQLPKGTNVDTMIASLVGPLFYRRWFSREPVSDAFALEIARNAVRTPLLSRKT